MTSRTRRWLTRGTTLVVVAGGCLWSLSFVFILLFKEEGLLPPEWRVPETPPRVVVLDNTHNCGSGGCWREITLRPPAGTSPEDLKRQLGLERAEELPPTLTDPGFVSRGARIRDGDVIVIVRYS
ncbi:hypothetical protein [Actinoplanes sp. NPDC026670]|uniref:hypothetical protein n=1 Tax=Actinoplanes sp. NPDC026670 TaxID=3154700 RepID=UPI0033DF3841